MVLVKESFLPAWRVRHLAWVASGQSRIPIARRNGVRPSRRGPVSSGSNPIACGATSRLWQRRWSYSFDAIDDPAKVDGERIRGRKVLAVEYSLRCPKQIRRVEMKPVHVLTVRVALVSAL